MDALISSKRTFESKLFLEKAIEHNKKVQRKLQKLVDKSKARCKELYSAIPNNNYYDEAYFRREAWREYYFYPETGFIAYYMPFYSKNTTGFITNVINVTMSSANTEVQFLIDELKKTYNTFIKQFEKRRLNMCNPTLIMMTEISFTKLLVIWESILIVICICEWVKYVDGHLQYTHQYAV